MRVARIMAFLLALATLCISGYFVSLMPYNYMFFIPANVGACGCLIFWIKTPTRKKERLRAALGSSFAVPCVATTAALGFLLSPIAIWQVFAALTAYAMIVAIWAIVRVRRKADHPWGDYYKQVS